MPKLIGIPASPGVAIGKVHAIDRRRARVPRYHITPDQVPAELAIDQIIPAQAKVLVRIDRLAGLGRTRFIRFGATRGLRIRKATADKLITAARYALPMPDAPKLQHPDAFLSPLAIDDAVRRALDIGRQESL